MSFDIDKLAEKTENLSIDPVYDTNWCDMPDDIKLECIGKMELKERSSLRCTAKAEKSLVESQKVKIQYGNIRVMSFGRLEAYLYPKYQDEIDFIRKFGNVKKGFECLKFIWKVVVFENLAITNGDETDLKEEIMRYTGKISAKNIDLKECNSDMLAPIIQKMDNSVESIEMDARNVREFPVDEILEVTQVHNVPYWYIKDYDKTDILHKVAQKWIDKNSKAGITFQISVHEKKFYEENVFRFVDREPYDSFKEFLKHFADRIISQNKRRVRIRTNNPDRHILLERGLDPRFNDDLFNLYRVLVISAGMKESEYDDDCKAWASVLYPEDYAFGNWYDFPDSDTSDYLDGL